MRRALMVAATVIVFSLPACKKNDLPSIPPADVTVTALYADDHSYVIPVNVPVQLKNVETGQQYNKITDSTGKLLFEDIPAGIYDAAATVSFSGTQFTALSGVFTADSVTFNATATGQTINASSSNQIRLVLMTGKTGDLLIKQIYYAGSNTTTAGGFRDQFIEIYNNTAEVIYADSLCFSQIEGVRSATPSALYAYQSSGQYDWQQCYGMPATINANTDYVYCKTIFRIPGTGKQYPIQPGASIIIAQNALNHKAPYTTNNGTVITPLDPSLTIDLSGADFEAYYGTGSLNSDLENPHVPNIIPVQTYNFGDMVLDNPGRDGYIIFRYEGDLSLLPGYHYPRIDGQAPSASTKLFYQLPVSAIVDAVEIQHAVPANRFSKKLGNAFDAGYTFVPAGQYSSQSVIRKTVRTVNGRKILKDSNNSTEDFDYFNLAQPRGFK